jgi:hypothetical protein
VILQISYLISKSSAMILQITRLISKPSRVDPADLPSDLEVLRGDLAGQTVLYRRRPRVISQISRLTSKSTAVISRIQPSDIGGRLRRPPVEPSHPLR